MRKIYTLFAFLFILLTINSSAQVVINEVYGGGGNSGSTYKNDFIELYNNGASAIDLTGWSVQYASATGTSWTVTTLSGSIPAHGYYLIQEAQGAGGTVDLPTPDATGTIAMSGTAGKIALVNNNTALSGCPALGTYIDLVGFGTTANCFEGTGSTPAPSNTNSVQRNPEGADSNNNNTDFAAGLPSPSNSATGGGGPSSTVSVAAGTNPAEPSTNGSFTVTLSDPAPAGGITVNYSLSGSATLNADYTDPQSGSLTIPEGSSAGTLNITVMDDGLVDPAETIILTLNTVTSPYSILTASATITITDDDVPPPGPLSLTGSPYTQDFNTLEATATTGTVLPEGWFFSESGSGANTTYGVGTGSSNSGNTYSFGASGSTERAFGTLLSGSVTPTIGAYITNNTGTTITRLGISYTGEEWRLGTAARTDRLDFQYSLDATDLSTGSWTDVDDLDFITPNTATTGALDGNAAANQTAVSYTITGLSIPAGSTFYIRWNDFNASGADDGLAIDDITIEANPVDLVAPVVVSLSPANTSADVSTNISAAITFSEPVQKGTGTITIKKTADNSVVQMLDVNTAAVTVTNATVSFNIPGLDINTGYYIEVSSGAFTDLSSNPFAGISGISTWAFTTGTTFYVADFNTCSTSLTDGFTQYSATGDIVWGCTGFGRDPAAPAGTAAYPYGVQINGFANGTNVPNIDWLISPSFDLTGTTYPLLAFWSRTAFNGLPLQLKVSTDYTGGDPASATWTDVNGRFPLQTSNIWTLSENINLSAFKTANVHFAFVYTSTPDDGARWTLDDIKLINSQVAPPPSLTISTSDIQYPFVAAGATADKQFVFTGNDLTGDVTLNVTGNFLISKDGTSFVTSLDYTEADANNTPETVYVRFAPSQANQDFTGSVSISTSSLTGSVDLKGTSIDPATTLEVVNWNLEWFGSTSLGPTDDNQQEQNIKTVLQNVGADVYGLVEVVDEARLANIVSQMPGYSYVICNYGSHTNTSESGAGPLSEAQKEAFVYKTSLLSNITTEPLLSQGINSAADLSNPAYNYWASGRFPYMMTADVTLNCVTKKIRFVLVHAKANTSPTATSYARRKSGADTLYYTLNQLYPNDNIIILGDFNDDLDQSITAGFTTTSWNIFTDDAVNYDPVTLPLSLAGKKSTVSYNDIIDHVIISDDLKPFYIPGSANILNDVASLVTNYGSTTTDHYPAFSRYIFRNTTAPVVTTCTPEVHFCVSADDTYTIPAFVATDDCNDVLSYSYTITGATERSGTGNDASGLFNEGSSVIEWTATDSWGNSVQCQTTVVVNANPIITIPDAFALPSGTAANTVYIGYTPASSISLTADVSDGTPAYTYNWSTSATGSGVTVSPASNTTYSVTVTDANGCQATAEKDIIVMDIRGGRKLDKVVICHNSNTLEVSGSSVPAHLAHGDMLGSCAGQPAPTRLTVKVAPNPSASLFTLLLNTNNDLDNIYVRVIDVFGRVLEQKQLAPGSQNLTVGSQLRPGLYYLEVRQKNDRDVRILVKTHH